MEANGVVDSELSRLKKLASALLAAESSDPAVLDEMASLAVAVAAQCREQARQELLGLVVEAARAVFPSAIEDLQSRLAQASQVELSSLGALLDDAGEARAAFARADAGLMAARGKGEYGAMVPFALDAESRKKTLAAASAEFATRIGYRGSLAEEIPVLPAPKASGGEVGAAEADTSVAVAVPADPAGSPADPEPLEESPAGRRRIRDLIRQVRSMPEEAPRPSK